MGQQWVNMAQACRIYGVSRRTLTRWINQGKIESKLENKRRLVLVSDVGHGETEQGHNDSGMSQDVSQQALVEQLKSEIARLEKQLETKDKQIEREQMISMQLSRDISEQKEQILKLGDPIATGKYPTIRQVSLINIAFLRSIAKETTLYFNLL